VRRAAPALAAVALAAALAGCGTPAADLFVVQRSGSIPGASLKLLVSDDGTARCNGAKKADMGDPRLLDARALVTDLEQYAKRDLELVPGPGSVLTYHVRMEAGTVGFSDTSRGQPQVFRRLAAFTRDVAKNVCGLAR
jgi:hypothetical protein